MAAKRMVRCGMCQRMATHKVSVWVGPSTGEMIGWYCEKHRPQSSRVRRESKRGFSAESIVDAIRVRGA